MSSMEVLGHVADEDEEVASSHVTRRARPKLLPQPPQRDETMVISSLNVNKA